MHPRTVGKMGETDEALSRAIRQSLGSLHLTCLHVRATSCLPESRTHHGQATAVLSGDQAAHSRPSGPRGPGQPTGAFWQCLSDSLSILSLTVCFFSCLSSMSLRIRSRLLTNASDSGQDAFPPWATDQDVVRIKMFIIWISRRRSLTV